MRCYGSYVCIQIVYSCTKFKLSTDYLCSKMERRVAQTLNCFADKDFDLFADTDRPALMDLLHDYFCGDAPDSGMRAAVITKDALSNNE